MNIILIAHEKKKELLLRFCEAYNGVLKKHSLFSTEDLRLKIINVVNCSVSAFLSGDRGGYQQVESRIACNEVDLVVFFKDPFTKNELEKREVEIERLCDVYAVPIATNIAAAELMILGVERGDLNWRMVMNNWSLAKLDKLKPAMA